jgi:hypothetical protein
MSRLMFFIKFGKVFGCILSMPSDMYLMIHTCVHIYSLIYIFVSGCQILNVPLAPQKQKTWKINVAMIWLFIESYPQHFPYPRISIDLTFGFCA